MNIFVFDYLILLPLLAMFTNILLGLYIYIKDPSGKLNKIFFLFSIFLSIWSFGNFFHAWIVSNYGNFNTTFSQIIEITHFGNVFTTIGSGFQAAFLLHFLLLFTKSEYKIKTKFLTLSLYLPAIFFTYIEFLKPIYLDEIMWPFWYGLVIYIIIYTLIGLFICYKYREKVSSIQNKKQASLVIYAILIPLIGGIIFELIPRVISFRIASLTTSFTTIMALIIAYTIIRHKLMIPLKERLKITEDKYKQLFNTIPDSIILLSSNGIVIEINDKAIEKLGISKEKIIGNKIDDVFLKKEDENRLNIIKKYLHINKVDKFEEKIGDGYFQYIFVPTKTFDGLNNVLVIERDISEQKKAEIKIKEANKIINSVNETLEKKVEEKTQEISNLFKQKEQFIVQLSHDLKTPLGPILNLLKVIYSKEKDQDKKEMLDVIQNNVDYIKNLVIKSLDIARLNSDNTNNKISNIDIKKIFDTYFVNKKYLLEEKKLTIENNIKKDFKIKANEYEFEILISNLIENAINYNIKNGKIIVNAIKKNGFIEVSIKDTGIGMTRDQIKNAFDEFYKADESRHNLNSTGLGLSICKKIVKRFKGIIWIESDGMGEGITVYFTIPNNM